MTRGLKGQEADDFKKNKAVVDEVHLGKKKLYKAL